MKALRILKNIVVILVAVLAFCIMVFTILSANTFNRVDRSLFGYHAFIVLSDSMSATDFQAGDLILVENVEPSSLKAGDIISFYSSDPANYGEITTHKIRELTTDTAGNPGFITYGTTTGVDDSGIVTYSDIIGKYTTHFPRVGYFFQFLKTPMGYILCILFPFLFLILTQMVNSVHLFRQYKAEQMEELREEQRRQREAIDRERQSLEAEREKSRKMIEELRRMKEELSEEKITSGKNKE